MKGLDASKMLIKLNWRRLSGAEGEKKAKYLTLDPGFKRQWLAKLIQVIWLHIILNIRTDTGTKGDDEVTK